MRQSSTSTQRGEDKSFVQRHVSTYFRLELIEPSARGGFFFSLVESEENGSNLARHKTAPDLKKISFDPEPLQQTSRRKLVDMP